MKMKEVRELDLKDYHGQFVIVGREVEMCYRAFDESTHPGAYLEIIGTPVDGRWSITLRSKKHRTNQDNLYIDDKIVVGEEDVLEIPDRRITVEYVPTRIFVEAVPADMHMKPRPRNGGYWKH
jgi:hypothetical protein